MNNSDSIKEILAEYVGVDKEEISDEDTLSEDLHMSASDLTNLSEILKGKGITEVDFTVIKTVGELADEVSLEIKE